MKAISYSWIVINRTKIDTTSRFGLATFLWKSRDKEVHVECITLGEEI
jgi:hypothetical protein